MRIVFVFLKQWIKPNGLIVPLPSMDIRVNFPVLLTDKITNRLFSFNHNGQGWRLNSTDSG